MSTIPNSFYWYDLETTGKDSRSDRIVQFAGLRTNANLEPIDQPYSTFIKLPPQVLPHPEAVMVTGILPEDAEQSGIDEFNAICAIHDQLIQPNTCTVGYNNLNFDDEFIRFALFRNLLPPYKWEYDKGNSRFDLYNVVRATAAFQPHLLEWPTGEEGVIESNLSALAEANGIDSSGAHDALRDVEMSIDLARKIKQGNEAFWQYLLTNRGRRDIEALLREDARFYLLVDRTIGAKRHFAAPVKVLATHPTISNRRIFADLSQDLSMLETATPQEMNDARFLSTEEAEEKNLTRLAINDIAINKCPVFLARNTLSDMFAERLQVDQNVLKQNLELLERIDKTSLEKRLQEMCTINELQRPPKTDRDVSECLYDGFIDNQDSRFCEQVHQAIERNWTWPTGDTKDIRIRTLNQRLQYELRPETLPDYADEHWDWIQHCLRKEDGGVKSMRERIHELRKEERSENELQILAQLETYIETIAEAYDV